MLPIGGSRSGPAERLRNVTRKQPFEKLVADHGRAILRVCHATLGPADADDAWSDTFLSALQAYPKLPADANVEAWLVTIAHRKAIDILRRSGRAALPLAELPTRESGARADSRDLDLAGSLATLPERQRFAVVYHYLVGLPYSEVAAVIGGSAEAARRAASDGVATLRKTQGAHR